MTSLTPSSPASHQPPRVIGWEESSTSAWHHNIVGGQYRVDNDLQQSSKHDEYNWSQQLANVGPNRAKLERCILQKLSCVWVVCVCIMCGCCGWCVCVVGGQQRLKLYISIRYVSMIYNLILNVYVSDTQMTTCLYHCMHSMRVCAAQSTHTS